MITQDPVRTIIQRVGVNCFYVNIYINIDINLSTETGLATSFIASIYGPIDSYLALASFYMI